MKLPYSLEWRLQKGKIEPDEVLARESYPPTTRSNWEIDAVYYTKEGKLRENIVFFKPRTQKCGRIEIEEIAPEIYDTEIDKNPLISASFRNPLLSIGAPIAGYAFVMADNGLDGLQNFLTQEYGWAYGLGAFVACSCFSAMGALITGEYRAWKEFKKRV